MIFHKSFTYHNLIMELEKRIVNELLIQFWAMSPCSVKEFLLIHYNCNHIFCHIVLFSLLRIFKQLKCLLGQLNCVPYLGQQSEAQGKPSILIMQVINASSNFLIYLFAGVSFRSKFTEMFKISSLCKSKQETKEAPPVNGCSQLFRRFQIKIQL